MASKFIDGDWGTFSRRFVAHQGLPHGTELKLFHPGGRKARVDLQVSRRRVNAATSTPLKDDETVSALRRAALALVHPAVAARKLDKLELQVFRPDGRMVPGNTRVKSVRRMPPAPTAHQAKR